MHGQLAILASHLNNIGWEDTLQPLQDEDIHAPDEEESNVGEGQCTLTWIWRTGAIGRSDSAAQEGTCAQCCFHDSCSDFRSVLWIEWCKARARAHRWQEECLLLKEEMRCIVQFFDSKVAHWNGFVTNMVRTPTL